MNETTTAFLSGVEVPVDALQIERELASLWKPASDLRGGEGAVVRSCMSNLVAYLPHPEEWEAAQKLFQDVSSRHPCRTILLEVGELPTATESNENQRSRLRASVTANCFSPLGGGNAPVCCEQITLRCQPEDVVLLPGGVTPLLVPDIPIFLWWTGDPGCPLLVELAQNVDRVIINTRDDAIGKGRLSELARLAREEQVKEVVDLGWRGLIRWREAIAKAFDAPALNPLLGHLDCVEVLWALPEGQMATSRAHEESALLIGWIASRLGLEKVECVSDEVSQKTCIYEAKNGRRIQLAARSTTVEPSSGSRKGEPRSVAFKGAEQGKESWVTFELPEGDFQTLRLNWQTPRECLLAKVLPFPRPDCSELLREILNTPTHPHIFRDSLEAAASFVS